MKGLRKAMHNLNRSLEKASQHPLIPFEEFVKIMVVDPERVIRNVFQVFHSMVQTYVGSGEDEYPEDPESINYVNYDTSKLFVEGSDHPFFADRLFANRLIKHVEALKLGAQQNKIYIFEGPHGSGKSTFFNNLLRKFEEYVNTPAGMLYETVWRFDRRSLGAMKNLESGQLLAKLSMALGHEQEGGFDPQAMMEQHNHAGQDYLDVCCPSHDNPLLMIPKHYRRQFFDEVFENDEFKWKLFTEKEYEWIFQDIPCTICSSLYDALLGKVTSPLRALSKLYVRPYHFNRRLGEGISVFNPGDPPIRQNVQRNPIIQSGINNLLNDSNRVKYIYSNYAKTNNGIYALMDIKGHNTERLAELHNIISEGVHKVVDIEENVNSLLFALMNPEDKKNIADIQSFSDRIQYINISYIMDIKTEVEIYKHIFGRHILSSFLPTVLHNFARVIIASRMNPVSAAMSEWIEKPEKYALYCDKNLLLLKMEIYTGFIPTWLTEEDRRRLNAKRRSRIIAESESEGRHGFSGRDSIKIFNEFYSSYAKSDKLITMSMLCTFFYKYLKGHSVKIPEGFLDSLLNMYDYKILQEVKECLYYYNEEQIAREIKNYLFAINFELGADTVCKYTGEHLQITEEFLANIELKLMTVDADKKSFRKNTQREYTANTLTQEIMQEGKEISKTKLFQELHERYIYNLKEKVLEPFLENENFRRAIRDFEKESFKTYDKKIRNDVTFLIENLGKNFGYTRKGAKETCIYVIDNDLAKKFSQKTHNPK